MLKVRTEKFGDVTVLHCTGRIVSGDAIETLGNNVFAQADANCVVIDLNKVGLIDAGGLGALLKLREWTQSRGIEFRITNVTKLVQQVLEMTRLDTVFVTEAEHEKSSAARN
jgi:anti-anti-sigma factor